MSKVSNLRSLAKKTGEAAIEQFKKTLNLWEAFAVSESERASEAEYRLNDVGHYLRQMPLLELRREVNEFFVAERIIEAQGRDAVDWFAMWGKRDRATESYLARQSLKDLPLEYESVSDYAKRYRETAEFFARLATRLERGLKKHEAAIVDLKSKRR